MNTYVKYVCVIVLWIKLFILKPVETDDPEKMK